MTKTLITFFWNEKKIIWNKNKQKKEKQFYYICTDQKSPNYTGMQNELRIED